ncbi:LicD family protein [Lacticaseibacillus camelliae]|uniref:LicD3 protein n=1 Tax=Lacticaseibacillus camelliae DSM 22697 = JCM 13995 TaxID=1423730 RepID=A0A0R2EYX3_9LACO|nr:LicD family protein [Lacticaseibacillus camelliae]KRN21632.1 licD3 protein [Lacticaseibacillus camelliae DSM 22697 = JCM 13995]
MYSNDPKLAKVQHATLKIARVFVDFCQSHELLCYFCGGGAIGAVREHGFVPWDDDLDFFMPRADYQKLIQLWPKGPEQRFALEVASQHFVNRNNFVTVRDRETTFIKTYQKDLDVVHGVAIDVFPLDVAPVSKVGHDVQRAWAMVYALFSEQLVPETHGGIIAAGSRLLLGLFRSEQMRYRIWRFAEHRMTRYQGRDTGLVTELCVGPKYMGNRYPETAFKSAVMLPFEDTAMPLPVGYDIYLRQVFGNYMQRPPKAQQKPHHDAVFIDPEHSYTRYEGRYYLTKH